MRCKVKTSQKLLTLTNLESMVRKDEGLNIEMEACDVRQVPYYQERGWIWFSGGRWSNAARASPQPIPLSSGPEKRLIRVRRGGVVESKVVSLNAYNQLMEKRHKRQLLQKTTVLSSGRRVHADGRTIFVTFGDNTTSKVESEDKTEANVVESVEYLSLPSDPGVLAVGILKNKVENINQTERKVGNKTTLVNVSYGLSLPSQNRLEFPKIAHRAPVCDQLLDRKVNEADSTKKEVWLPNRPSKTMANNGSRFILEDGKLRKLALSGGRTWTPTEFHFKITKQFFRRNMELVECMLFKEP